MNRCWMIFLRVSLIAIVGTLALSSLHAQDSKERVWKDKTGEFSVKAELIKVEDGNVFLRRADNGKIAKVAMKRLCEADRDFLAADHAKTEKGASKSNLKLSGKMIWSEAKFGFGEEEPKRWLQLEIVARGKAAAEALEFGMLQLDSMQTDDGKMMQARKERFESQDISKIYKKVDRNDKFFAKHPKNGVRMLVDIESTDDKIKKVAQASGSFQIKTGGDKSSFKIENTGSMDGQSVEMQEFEDLGVQAGIKVKNQMLSLELDGNHSAVHRVEVHNPSGKIYKNFSGGGEGGGGSLHQFNSSSTILCLKTPL